MDELLKLKTDRNFLIFEAGYKYYRSLVAPCGREYDESAFITCAKAYLEFIKNG